MFPLWVLKVLAMAAPMPPQDISSIVLQRVRTCGILSLLSSGSISHRSHSSISLSFSLFLSVSVYLHCGEKQKKDRNTISHAHGRLEQVFVSQILLFHLIIIIIILYFLSFVYTFLLCFEHRFSSFVSFFRVNFTRILLC